MSTPPPRLTRFGLRFVALLAAAAAGYSLHVLHGVQDAAVSLERGDKPVAAADVPAEGAGDITQAAIGLAENSSRENGFGPALGPAGDARMPGEFEHVDALLLGVNELIEYHPETLVAIVKALDGGTAIVALLSKPEQEQRTLDLLKSHGIATDRIRFFIWPAESMWVQDFGPQVVLGDDVRVVDFEYAVPGREIENQLPMAFAATFGMKVAHCHLVMEGGSFLSNGRGLCISSTRMIDQNQTRGYDLQAIGRILHDDFGFERWAYVPPLVGESTGHLDLFLTLGGPSTVLLAAYDPAEDHDNARRMDENARVLAEQLIIDGQPLEIIRIRQPAARDGCWRSYTNVIYGNGVVIVPQFPDTCPELDRGALDVYRRVFPDRRVVGVDTSKIIHKRGGLHCLSLSIPRLPSEPRRDTAAIR